MKNQSQNLKSLIVKVLRPLIQYFAKVTLAGTLSLSLLWLVSTSFTHLDLGSLSHFLLADPLKTLYRQACLSKCALISVCLSWTPVKF